MVSRLLPDRETPITACRGSTIGLKSQNSCGLQLLDASQDRAWRWNGAVEAEEVMQRDRIQRGITPRQQAALAVTRQSGKTRPFRVVERLYTHLAPTEL